MSPRARKSCVEIITKSGLYSYRFYALCTHTYRYIPKLEANAKQAVVNLNLTAEVSHITDPMEIAMRGVISTPSMIINGKVVSQ